MYYSHVVHGFDMNLSLINIHKGSKYDPGFIYGIASNICLIEYEKRLSLFYLHGDENIDNYNSFAELSVYKIVLKELFI